MQKATRDRIAVGARDLFARHGYNATTMEAIARKAGMAVQTIYANFRTKRAILLYLVESAESDPDLAEIARQFRSEGDPGRLLRLGAAFNQRFFERAAALHTTLHEGAASDAALAEAARVVEEGRRARCLQIVRGWVATRNLRRGLTERKAADIMFALSGPEIYRLLVTRSGWMSTEYAKWLVVVIESLLTPKGQHRAREAQPRRRKRRGS